jgi:hypothetical protein
MRAAPCVQNMYTSAYTQSSVQKSTTVSTMTVTPATVAVMTVTESVTDCTCSRPSADSAKNLMLKGLEILASRKLSLYVRFSTL